MHRMMLFLTVFIFGLALHLSLNAQAAEINLCYGEDIPYHHWRSKGVKTHASELEVRAPWKEWLEVAIAVSVVWSKTAPGHVINGIYLEGTNTNLILAGRLVAHRMLSKHVFIEGYGGLGWMTPSRQPEMGNSGMVGNFGANIGYRFSKWHIKYGMGHWSDILQRHDKGHNRHYFKVGWEF